MGLFFSKKSKSNHPLSDREFKEVLSFFRSITDDLYVVDEDWEDGMKEYTYDFRSQHDRIIGKDRYVFPYHNIYICKDNSGKYHSSGKTFSCLKDAQVHFMMRWFNFYDQYCDYMNI